MSWYIRSIEKTDAMWMESMLDEARGDATVVVHGEVFHPLVLPGLVALGKDDVPAGLLTYQIDREVCEIITLNALDKGAGVATALLESVARVATAAGCERLEVTTTNDNLAALALYQKRGFVLTALHVGAVDRSRQIKPSIPRIAANGLPIRDELVLTRPLP